MPNLNNIIGRIPDDPKEIAFEDLYFGYNSDEDHNGSRGIGLADAVIQRAKKAGMSTQTWINLHRFYYQMRKDKEMERYNSHL